MISMSPSCGDCRYFYPLPRSIITDDEGEVMGGMCQLHNHNIDDLQVCQDWKQKDD